MKDSVKLRYRSRIARAKRANDLLSAIAILGRCFFRYDIEGPAGISSSRTAYFEVDRRCRVWFHDEYTQKRIYTHYDGRWRGFNGGGTLKRLCESLRDFIMKGARLHPKVFGPWPDWVCEGDLWGYGPDMQFVRERAEALGITAEAAVQ